VTYSPEEFATKGSQLYRDLVLPKLNGDCDGKIVAIDIETGEFELADNTLAAAAGHDPHTMHFTSGKKD
jgi:hypothetical protein